jgi:hypothetical protein
LQGSDLSKVTTVSEFTESVAATGTKNGVVKKTYCN